MRKVYCYAEKEEKPEEIDHSGDIVQDLSSLDISDIKNRRFFFIGGEIIENPYYEPSEYMKRVYAAIDVQYERFYRSDNDKKDSDEKDDVKDAEGETNEQSSDDEMPDWIAEMPYGELIKRFPGGISEALEYAKKEKGLSVLEVHYDSPEPEKLGVKAFTKNAEVYLAPGEGEETLKHELGHVIQQKKEKIPATTKIGEQQVNLDPKLEQEADEIAKHIGDHISEIISNESVNTETKDVIQFKLPSDKELKDKIKRQAKNMGMSSDLIMDSAIEKTKEYYNSKIDYLTSWFYTSWFKDYLDVCINWALQSIKIENACSAKLFEIYPGSVNMGITKSLEDAKHYEGDPDKRMLNDNQYKKIINCLKKLSNYCDEKGLSSVLEGANINVIASYSMLRFYKQDDEDFKGRDYFVKRLVLMSDYIEEVAKQKDTDGKTFGEKYWVRSTGSDPHKNGEHALFLIPKTPEPIDSTLPTEKREELRKYPLGTRVYKPHDLTPDTVVVGQNDMFAELNSIIDTSSTILAGAPALATMEIDTDSHTEKFIRKTRNMDSDSAQKYFFRAGILKAITDAMAVIDLHCDNIMPTEQGPIIIDAEVDFFHYGQDSSLVGGNAPALSTDEIGYNRANASFDIEDPASPTTKKSGEAFRENSFSCKDKYTEGYNFMLGQLQSRQEKISNMFRDQLNNLHADSKIRILPLSTEKFAEFLNRVINGEKESEVAEELKNTIKANLTSENAKFLDSAKIKVELDDRQLQETLLTTFTNGTIPAMYADMNGNLYLDDKTVGKIVSKIDDEELKVNVQVNKQQMASIMKDCFINELGAMHFLEAAPEAT